LAGRKGLSGGHNKKPVAKHIEKGSWRPDRHGSADAFVPGTPQPVLKFGEVGQQLWDQTLKNLPPNAVATIDAYKLSLLCQCWELLQAAIERWTSNPGDTQSRLAVNQLTQTVDRLGSQFGCSPRDRQRMRRVDWEPDQADDPFAKFLNGDIG
jgi:phage terminase small subunit